MKLTCPDYTLVWQTRIGRSRQSPPAAGPTARREGCTIQGCKVVFEPKVSWMACMSCERLLHEYPTKVKELLFLERRVSKLFKVRDIAIYKRCYPRNLGQRNSDDPTRIPTN
jgi:hypothetical protein